MLIRNILVGFSLTWALLACQESSTTAPQSAAGLSSEGSISSSSGEQISVAQSSTGLILSSSSAVLGVSSGMSSAGALSSAGGFAGCPATLKDARDGHVYKLTSVGSQCWMAQHLDYGMVLTATDAPGVDAMVEKYCPGNDPSQCSKGASYLWHELMGMSSDCIDKNCNSQLASPLVQVCPAGMRVPTPAEWASLVSQLNSSATVRTAFAWTAVEHKFGSAMSLQGGCAWTSAGGSANATAYCYDLGESGIWASQTFTRHNYGFPVRCIKSE